MISFNDEVVSLLKNDPDITAIINKRVYPNHPPKNAKTFPIVTYFEVSNVPNQYADNKVISSKIAIQIDIWTKRSSPSNLAILIDKLMFNNKYKRFYTGNRSEATTGINHKILRYRKLAKEPI